MQEGVRMKKFLVAAVMAALVGATLTHRAQADTADATCDVRKDGDKQKGKSGPCTFGQRQGYIDIDLKNGDTISLSPVGNGPGKYKDQNGNKVTRTSATTSGMDFKWESGKKLSVTYLSSGGNHGYVAPGATASGMSQHPENAGGGGDNGNHFINELDNGGFEVVWKGQSCFISYNASGRSTSVSPGCNDKQIRRSDEIARDRTH
jgi:hypothetical protein